MTSQQLRPSKIQTTKGWGNGNSTFGGQHLRFAGAIGGRI